MYTRRHLLVAVGAATTAGCMGALGSDADGGGSSDTDRVRLEELSVQNNHDDDRRVLLAIEADSEMLHLGTYDLGGGGGSRAIEGEWTEEADSYRVHARLEDGDIQTANLTEGVGSDADCVRVLIRIDADGELGVWHGANCGADADDLENA